MKYLTGYRDAFCQQMASGLLPQIPSLDPYLILFSTHNAAITNSAWTLICNITLLYMPSFPTVSNLMRFYNLLFVSIYYLLQEYYIPSHFTLFDSTFSGSVYSSCKAFKVM
jgi:hypothetical protein